MQYELLTERIIRCAYIVHNLLGPGFLEKVYENALRIELNFQGLEAIQQTPIKVYYKKQVVGEYYADLLVENVILVEIKSIQNLAKEHEVQLVNYLTATGNDVGLLINFGSRSVQIRRKVRDIRPFIDTVINPV